MDTSWVKDRYNCTLEMAFLGIKDYVERDIEDANSLIPNRDGKFVLVKDKEALKNRFIVKGWPIGSKSDDDEKSVIFELHKTKITITPNIVITHKWNPDLRTCTLWVKDVERTKDQISQIALDSLFFEMFPLTQHS